MKMFQKAKLATGAVAGILTIAITGSAAYAALVPVQPVATAAIHATDAETTASERGDKNAGLVRALEAILGRLVANGTITAEQKAAILEAVAAPAEEKERPGQLKRIWNSLIGLSVEYLGVSKQEVHETLRSGTSLGDLADATEGKTREGLMGFLQTEVTALIDAALAEEKLTEELAEHAKTALPERVTDFVDHVYAPRGAKERLKEFKERAKEFKERAKELRERAKERLEDHKERMKERRDEQTERQDEDEDEDQDEDEAGGI